MVLLVLGLILYVLALCVVCAAALIRGGRDERKGALGLLAASAASQVVTIFGPHFRGPEYPLMILDAVFLVFLVRLAVGSPSYWPIWAAASQLNGTLAHLAAVFSPLPMKVYALTQPFWGFPIIAAIAVGVWTNRKPAMHNAPRTRPLRHHRSHDDAC